MWNEIQRADERSAPSLNMEQSMYRVKTLATLFSAILLTGALGCASTRTHEGTGEYVDDSVITTKVKAAILHEPGLKVSEINVETYKGVVQLSGFVTSRADIKDAVRLASAVGGVKSVTNEMHVK
jgi:osmotically-inducible protein OsmY